MTKNSESKKPSSLNVLDVLIRDRNKIYFHGFARTLISKDAKGEFGILAHHANFIALIKEYIVIDKGMATEEKFNIGDGVLSIVEQNVVNVYLGV